MLQAVVTRKYSLSALHSLANPALSDAENYRIFGPCFRLHGHEYLIEVTVAGPISAESGLVISREVFDRIVEEHLIEPLANRYLNDRFPITTGESLALEFFAILSPHFSRPLRLQEVMVQETPKNLFSVVGGW